MSTASLRTFLSGPVFCNPHKHVEVDFTPVLAQGSLTPKHQQSCHRCLCTIRTNTNATKQQKKKKKKKKKTKKKPLSFTKKISLTLKTIGKILIDPQGSTDQALSTTSTGGKKTK